MRIAVAGSSGLIGAALVPALERAGHEVVALVRREPEGAREVRWDPAAGGLDRAALGRVDALVNLAGATIDTRWTDERKREIRESRLQTTALLAEAAAAAADTAPALVCASAIGFYGDRGDEELTEESAPGDDGFLTRLVRDWEAAAEPARAAGRRVVTLRTGLVLSGKGGLLARMLLPFKLGAGGRLASGQQWWSWILLDDVVRAYRHALESDLDGPVNLTAPNPVRNAEFTDALGRALHRPTLLPTPTPGLWVLFGREATREAILSGARVLPARLEASGFEWDEPQLDGALRRALAH